MDEAALRFRMAVREIFGACYPGEDFERAEQHEHPSYVATQRSARAVLGLRDGALPERRYLTAADVAFDIRYALGQAPASLLLDVRSKDRSKRDRALDRLVELVAARFAEIEMSHPLKPGWRHAPISSSR